MALGNIIGSNILNLLTVMAVPGLFTSVIFNKTIITRDIPILIFLTIGLIIFIHSISSNKQIKKGVNISRLFGLCF